MKKIGTILAIAFLITSCGGGESTTHQQDNLFLKASNQSTDKNISQSLLGLWESEDYMIGDVSYAVMWEITESKTTVAKKCTDSDGNVRYAQVSLDFDQELLSQNSAITPFSMPVQAGTKVSNVTLMPDNKACRVGVDSSQTSSNSLLASDTTHFDLTNGSFESGEMILTTTGASGSIKLVKTQNR